MTNVRVRNWCFTIFNMDVPMPPVDTVRVRYIVWQQEVTPTTNVSHIQGYAEFNVPVTMGQCKTIFADPTMHLEIRRGTRQQAREYCMKDDTRVVGTLPSEFGVFANAGQHTNLDELYKDIKNGASAGEIMENFPSLYIRHKHHIDELIVDRNRLDNLKRTREDYETVEWREWQREVQDKLEEQAVRQVLWVVDPTGNNGKSFLARYLTSQGAFLVRAGKHQDIYHAFTMMCPCPTMAVFDMTRSSEETIPYSVMESLKDGMIFSSKYQSKVITFTPLKLLVLSNFTPQLTGKLSNDRWEDTVFEIVNNRLVR